MEVYIYIYIGRQAAVNIPINFVDSAPITFPHIQCQTKPNNTLHLLFHSFK